MQNSGSAYEKKLKTAKWLFVVGVFLFVAKPFIGFALDPAQMTVTQSILVKSFTKRKHEYVENSSLDAKTIQKKLADPVNQLILLFSCLLSIVYPLTWRSLVDFTGQSTRKIKLALAPSNDTWLLNGQLII